METSDSLEAQVAAARERLEATRTAVARARADLADASTTARSKDRSVEVTFLQGTLNGNRLEILNSGEVVRFEKGVTLVIDRSEATPTKEADVRAGAR